MMDYRYDTVEDVVERVLDALRKNGSRVSPAGRGRWSAQCPSHEDRTPSLSIAQADDRVLLRCWAGCEFADVVDALRLEPRDLFAGRTSTSRGGWGW